MASPEELERILQTATRAAKEAGAVIRDNAGRTAVDHEKASNQDLVTAVDVRCQRIIEDAIRAEHPTHSTLGEESVDAGSAASAAAIAELAQREFLWVIDPLDGTTNFVHGLPFSAVSIGVAHRGRVVVGVVYEPYRGEES
jgi:myo-inositol-1(or 4)-monophosphatase